MDDTRIFKDKASASTFLFMLWCVLNDEPLTEEEYIEAYKHYAEDENNEEI
jgi:hypothetical protein